MTEETFSETALEAATDDALRDAWDRGYATATEGLKEVLEAAARLIRELTDPEDCQFDHHGGCQAHGYLSLGPGEVCPQLEAKEWSAL